MTDVLFEWDSQKDLINQERHGVSFFKAQEAFWDVGRVIAQDIEHSLNEKRYYCFGMVGCFVLTVRFTYRNEAVRIFGAGYWRKGKKIYEKENSKVHG